MNYKIEFLKEYDLPRVMQFIDSEWKRDHILAKSKDLFNWQYYNKNGKYNFVVAKIANDVVGILGFIPSIKYDENLYDENIIWLALWKISEKVSLASLGLKMLTFLQEKVKHKAIAVNGINKNVSSLYKALGYKISKLNHYYSININEKLELISSPPGYIHPSLNINGKDWELLNEDKIRNLIKINFFQMRSTSFVQKSPNYFLNRYIKHPFYNYQVYLILGSNKKENALIALRFDIKNSNKTIRIVDFYGDPKILNYAGLGLQKIMNNNKIEYADFWCYGIPDKIMNDFGFAIVDESKDIIVPTYFEPFQNSNNSILLAYKVLNYSEDKFVIFKGDGDQDRPNQL